MNSVVKTSNAQLNVNAVKIAGLLTAFAVAMTIAIFASSAQADPSGPLPTNSARQDGELDYRTMTNLTEQQMTAIQQLAQQQATIWGDTILEGDFEAAGDTRVDSVQGVFHGSALVGFLVTFSETAWSTNHCAYDPRDKKTLSTCISGRISESMFVTPDLKDAHRDERNSAHFLN